MSTHNIVLTTYVFVEKSENINTFFYEKQTLIWGCLEKMHLYPDNFLLNFSMNFFFFLTL